MSFEIFCTITTQVNILKYVCTYYYVCTLYTYIAMYLKTFEAENFCLFLQIFIQPQKFLKVHMWFYVQ